MNMHTQIFVIFLCHKLKCWASWYWTSGIIAIYFLLHSGITSFIRTSRQFRLHCTHFCTRPNKGRSDWVNFVLCCCWGCGCMLSFSELCFSSSVFYVAAEKNPDWSRKASSASSELRISLCTSGRRHFHSLCIGDTHILTSSFTRIGCSFYLLIHTTPYDLCFLKHAERRWARRGDDTTFLYRQCQNVDKSKYKKHHRKTDQADDIEFGDHFAFPHHFRSRHLCRNAVIPVRCNRRRRRFHTCRRHDQRSPKVAGCHILWNPLHYAVYF